MLLTVLFAGLVNWLVTLILVEGVIFKGVRASITHSSWVPEKLKYLVTCQLCAGTWVGFLLAALIPGPFTGPLPLLLNGFLYKAVGHLILQGFALAEARAQIAQDERDHSHEMRERERRNTANGLRALLSLSNGNSERLEAGS